MNVAGRLIHGEPDISTRREVRDGGWLTVAPPTNNTAMRNEMWSYSMKWLKKLEIEGYRHDSREAEDSVFFAIHAVSVVQSQEINWSGLAVCTMNNETQIPSMSISRLYLPDNFQFFG